MKTASLAELKKELKTLDAAQIKEICLRLAKYSKQNKELLTYLLFEAEDEQAYVSGVKNILEEQFLEINKSNLYLAKKGLRKILRNANKFIRYSGSKQTEVEVLIYFCEKVKQSGIPINSNQVLTNMFLQQLKKIDVALSSLHEDIQFDYQKELKRVLQ
ncbi:MAG TPA: hypothetical protein VK766_06940 [Cytophagaceae bacterium]|nr:hypothetical protein [Cytophagaceae bacterium]